MTIVTVNKVIKDYIIPMFDERERILYDPDYVFDKLATAGEIKVNGEIVKNLFHEVYEGDIVYYKGKEHKFEKVDLLFSWLSKCQSS